MAGDAYRSTTTPANSTAVKVGDPDTELVTVPSGEVWYIEGVGFGLAGAGNPTPDTIRAGIFAIGDASVVSDEFVEAPYRAGSNGAPTSQSDFVEVGAYAYPGELIAYGVDKTDSECVTFLSARAVKR